MMETNLVFIDTQYFVKKGFHFESPALASFRKLCEEGKLKHYSTSVVYNEVKSNLLASISESLDALKKFRRKGIILSAIEDENLKPLFAEISPDDVAEKAVSVLDEYFQGCGTNMLNADKVSAEEILSLYFSKSPPFGTGNKKAEFPDAISLHALKASLKGGEKLYIVSDDVDLINFCGVNEQFVSCKSLDELLDLHNQHNARTDVVKKYFADHMDAIKQRIKEHFESCDLYNSSTWEDAEVDEFHVKEVGEIEPSIVFLSDDECQVTFEVEITYVVTVSGPDFNNGIYDREDGVMITFDTSAQEKEISDYFSVEVWLDYEEMEDASENISITSMLIPDADKGVEVSVEENEPDWY